MGHIARWLPWVAAFAIVGQSGASQSSSDVQAIEQGRYLFLLDDQDRQAIRRDALQYLARVDQGATDRAAMTELFDESPCAGRQGLVRDQFVANIGRARGALGAPLRRTLESVSGGFRLLPASPRESRYAIAVFDVTFAESKLFQTEQVTLEFFPERQRWGFCGYYLGVKPYYVY